MAKITMGEQTFEGNVEELMDLFAKMGVKFPVAEDTAESPYRKVTGREPRVGDFVKFTEETGADCVREGEYYRITRFDDFDDPQITDECGLEYDMCGDEYEVFERETGAEEEQSLEVGDYAKVVNNDNASPKLPLGTIVSITGKHPHIGAYDYRTLDGSYTGGAYEYRFVKATDEEVAEAQEAAKWAKIGRKPAEFKKGDIVRGERYDDKSVKFIGEIEDVNNGLDADVQGVRTYDGKYHAAVKVELITPVEQRFDRL
jgi:hypothetical protein